MKVVLFANTDWYLYNFRCNLALALRDRGDEVVLLSPGGEYAERLQAMGFRWMDLPFSRRGMNPLVELRTILYLARLFRREKPDLVHAFTIKSVLYGTLAARLAGVRAIVNSITGLGYIFMPGGVGKRLLRSLVRLWYRTMMRGTQVIFENEDDRQAFLRFGFIRPEEGFVTPGVGVDTDRFAPVPFPADGPVFLMAARLLWDKGVGEFVEAARRLRAEGIQARFALAGRTDAGNPTSIPEAQITAWRDEGVLEWWGWIEDMQSALARATVVCLPSYREGLPTVLIEAAACGRPVIASDVPGCRDTLEDGATGFLVRERDADSLAAAMRKLAASPALCQQMGAAGRLLVEDKFSSRRVVQQIFDIYAGALAKGARGTH
jgi:glycosyltransferase involved in cell wall biosynthesis